MPKGSVLRLCANCKIKLHGMHCNAFRFGAFCECRDTRCRQARLRKPEREPQMPSDIEWVTEMPNPRQRIDLEAVHQTLHRMREYVGKPAKVATYTNKGTAAQVRNRLTKSGDYKDFDFTAKIVGGNSSVLFAVCRGD